MRYFRRFFARAVGVGVFVGFFAFAIPSARSDDVMGTEQRQARISRATMEPDGTIVLQLRAVRPVGVVGDAPLRYPPDHPQYRSVLDHLGGMRVKTSSCRLGIDAAQRLKSANGLFVMEIHLNIGV
jgi:hypothetical protein